MKARPRAFVAAAPAFVAALLIAACSAPSAPPTGPVRCAPDDCLLPRPAGVRVQNEGDAPQFVDRATGARLTSERLDLADDPRALDRLLDRERADLETAASFEQAPQPPLGVVVRGVSGQRGPADGGILPDADPVRVRVLTFENPATRHVLVLRLEARASSLAHPDFALDAVLDGVVLGPGF